MPVVIPGGLGLRAYIFKYLLFGAIYFVLEATPLAYTSEEGMVEGPDIASFLRYIVMITCDSCFPS